MDELKYPTPVDTNNNPLQQLVDGYNVNGDVNACSEGGVGDNFNVYTDIFTGNEGQGIVDDVEDVDEYVVFDTFICDGIDVNVGSFIDIYNIGNDVNVNADCNLDGAGVRFNVNVSPEYGVDDNISIDAYDNFGVYAGTGDLLNGVVEKKANGDIDVGGRKRWVMKRR